MLSPMAKQVSKLLKENMETDIRSKFGFAIPKEILKPLITRAETAIICAVGGLPEVLIYAHVESYETEFEFLVRDVTSITGEDEVVVRLKLNEALDQLGNMLYKYVQTWQRLERQNAARVASVAQHPRKAHVHAPHHAR
jgi:fatty acid/phospholipid biosynthesis enzyme